MTPCSFTKNYIVRISKFAALFHEKTKQLERTSYNIKINLFCCLALYNNVATPKSETYCMVVCTDFLHSLVSETFYMKYHGLFIGKSGSHGGKSYGC